MKKVLSAAILITSFALTGYSMTACSNSDSSVSEQAKKPANIDLSGVWTHTNSANGEPGLEAKIDGNLIEVKWTIKENFDGGLYWLGTFDSHVPEEGETTFTSKRDKIATDNKLMAANADTKNFTYKNGVLSFPVKFQDSEFTVEMKKSRELRDGESVSSPMADSSFKNDTLATKKITFHITKHRIIPAGEPGNEWGNRPIIAFYFETTNSSDETVSASDWYSYFTVVQDNDANKVNKLESAGSIDEETADSLSDEIKPGGTVSAAIGYTLTDVTTPVELIAHGEFTDVEIGRQRYEVTE